MEFPELYVLEALIKTPTKDIAEPIGLFTTEEMAQKYLKECEDAIGVKNSPTTFNYRLMPINERPRFIDIYKDLMNEWNDKINKRLKGLMDDEYIEQLIGEDGEFYYRLTEKGKDAGNWLDKMF